jgi:hypothetical protein
LSGPSVAKPGKRQGSSSFLKKGTKKLLSVSGGTEFTDAARLPRATDKSFLVLFFKKELLPVHA